LSTAIEYLLLPLVMVSFGNESLLAIWTQIILDRPKSNCDMCACVLAFELLQGGKPVAWMYTHRVGAAALYSPLSKRERDIHYCKYF
jgi:hypothetical protein